MHFLLTVVAVLVAILLVIGIILLVVYISFRKKYSKEEIEMFIQALKGEVMSDKEAYGTKKSLSGMTKVYEPLIREDFKNFNLEQLYNEIESSLRVILNAKMKKDKSLITGDKFIYIRKSLEKEIDDLIINEEDIKYKDINFSKHVIKNYSKKNGTATIVTASQVSYYYDSNKIKEIKFKDIKKETIYICEFIYVYDENKFTENGKVIAINCPNCGAPVTGLDGGTCAYCNTLVKPINLKAWKLNSYKEDYRN